MTGLKSCFFFWILYSICIYSWCFRVKETNLTSPPINAVNKTFHLMTKKVMWYKIGAIIETRKWI